MGFTPPFEDRSFCFLSGNRTARRILPKQVSKTCLPAVFPVLVSNSRSESESGLSFFHLYYLPSGSELDPKGGEKHEHENNSNPRYYHLSLHCGICGGTLVAHEQPSAPRSRHAKAVLLVELISAQETCPSLKRKALKGIHVILATDYLDNINEIM